MECWKVAYQSRAAASKARKMGRAGRSRSGRNFRHRLSPYLCPWCKRWHLTSQEQR